MSIRLHFFFSIITLVIATSHPGFAQISPGELANAHSHLEGLSNCTKCHILGEKVSNQKCLDCHTELKSRIAANKGYHASSETKGKECIKCHSDHHGLNFKIIRFEKEKFNHDLTGYKLLGSHGKKQCTDCHKPEHISDQKIRKKNFTYLGLNPACLTCHADYHQKTLSANCENCHGFELFKPAGKFDHSKSKYPLSGKHQVVPCASCHKIVTKEGQKFQEFKGLKFENCTPCHNDVHQGKFGQNCTQCHTEQAFGVIKSTQTFDHNKTDYKLEGRHQKVACVSCHKTKKTNALKFGRCTDCHSDYHKKQFEKQGVSPDCSECHSVAGFTEFSYSIEQHNTSPFPLRGAHLATPCFACHKKDTVWSFREIGKRCIDCHKNIHQSFISEQYLPGGNCELCHNENQWSSVTFDHQKTKFTLVGAHAKKGCRDCHFKKDPEGIVHQQFTGMSTNCVNCHEDIHMSQFEKNGMTDCFLCHDQSAFKPVTKFDHSKTLFPLDGKHKDVACNKCHKPLQDKGKVFVLYKIKNFRCEDCHH